MAVIQHIVSSHPLIKVNINGSLAVIQPTGLPDDLRGPKGEPGLSGEAGKAGATGPAGPQGEAEIELVSNVPIGAYAPVASNGLIADSSNLSTYGRFVGLSKTSVGAGFSVRVVSAGKISNPTWSWTRGDKLYINGPNISTVSPESGYSQFVGTAIATDTITVEIQPPILL